MDVIEAIHTFCAILWCGNLLKRSSGTPLKPLHRSAGNRRGRSTSFKVWNASRLPAIKH